MFCAILGCIVITFISLIVLYSFKKDTHRKIVGIYTQPGKWYCLKYYTFLLVLLARRLKVLIFGKSILFKESELEKLQALSNDENAFDAVFFQAVSQNGIYLCAGTERRHGAKVNGLFYILMPGHDLLLSPKLPNTVLEANPETVLNLKDYSAEGICFSPVKPMKHWKVSYRGKMKQHNDPKNELTVKLEADWTSDLPWFMFETDMSCRALARAIARELWTKEYFQSLKTAHQTHYEQMGYLNGTLTIGDKTYKVQMDAFRDHSFGYKRDWSLMHRYIFHMMYLNDGTKISVGVVSQPCTSSLIEMGYIVHPQKNVEAIESCDLLLYQHGENGTPPKEIAFIFSANGEEYEAEIKYEVGAVHYVGKNTQAKMHERFFRCRVNGVQGRGISEWHYNNTK